MTHSGSVWKSNHGNLLLLVAAGASLAISGIWYFDLLPHIQLVSGELPVSVAATTKPPTVIVITLEAPEQIGDEPLAERQSVVRGFVRVHPPFGDLPLSAQEGLALREFEISDQQISPVVFTEVPAGQYALSAFLDLNDNGQLDVDANGIPVEPYRLSNSEDSVPPDLDLERATVRLNPAQSLNLRFDFHSNRG